MNEIDCPECNGWGTIPYYSTMVRVCQRCYGSNKDPNGGYCKRCACIRCKGTGKVNDPTRKAAMKELTGKVVRIELGDQFIDKKPRATLRIDQADSMYNELRLSFEDSVPALGQLVTLEVLQPEVSNG